MLRRAWRWLRGFGWLRVRPVVFDQPDRPDTGCGAHCSCRVQP